MKKTIIIALMAGSLLSLTACGNSQDKSKNNTNSSSKTQTSSEPKQYKVAEDMMNNERIYYELKVSDDNIYGVDTYIESAYVFKDGKVEKIVSDDDLTLGDLKGLTNDEIIAKMKKNLHSEYLKEKEGTSSVYYQSGIPGKFEVSVVTDATGNNIQEMKIRANSTVITTYRSLDYKDEDDQETMMLFNMIPSELFTVYNQEYSKLSSTSSNSDDEEVTDLVYVTRYDGSAPIADTLDESFIKVSD